MLSSGPNPANEILKGIEPSFEMDLYPNLAFRKDRIRAQYYKSNRTLALYAANYRKKKSIILKYF